ncbi:MULTISPECIES: TetR/AcrR family transcriptional regulator [Paenibacillus]|uniref:TetR family transcriptional regulator n=1 Tax=Paenibacillus anseongense TaxID=2682845 RepID=A0ABW9UJ96_9BACL|nr:MULTISPECIES: TetR/AcrR family transcriptional regulator [Paenibacillus]MBA2938550.1 TetR/AcrR family transcriptional regulator [Paenibacillus sp. CGMCC 1.16610]MVQ38743.1 TetR family transcriptional regulator [Paenibacillus anseongense]
MARNKEFEVNAVLRKAMHIFWEQGYEKTSMQDLVTHMGIHRRSIYDTFGDKHRLYMKAVEKYGEMLESSVHQKVEAPTPMKQAIRRMFEHAIVAADDRPKGCLIVNTAVELAVCDEEAAAKVNQSFVKTEDKLYDLVLRGKETGEIGSHHDARRISEFLNNAFIGLCVLAKTTNDKEKLEGIIDTSLAILD